MGLFNSVGPASSTSLEAAWQELLAAVIFQQDAVCQADYNLDGNIYIHPLTVRVRMACFCCGWFIKFLPPPVQTYFCMQWVLVR